MSFLATGCAESLPPQTEASFRRQVVAYAELMGWRCWFTWRSDHSPKGWPDLVLIRRPRIVFLELKGARTPITDDQRATIEDLQACGLTALIVRPKDWKTVERLLA